MKLIFSLVIAVTLSPIWPLGQNPLIGDPYIIINKHTNELAYVNYGAIQEVYPIATGVTADMTPEGEYTITVKAKDPYYRRKDIIGGSKNNPLGTRWLGFDARETDGRIYGIHGTNNEESIGKYVSNGCVRMHNKNVENLFNKVPVGTKVYIYSKDISFEQVAKIKRAIP
ncbi:L,D-transpeptidase [Cytobacillus suaedae]|nr:L,D-transpeptidase [Cytobacillus suaedae]